MNALMIINEQEVLGKQFRVYGTFEEPLFLAADVKNWIEHSNITKMLNSVDDDEKVKRLCDLTISSATEECDLTNSYITSRARKTQEMWFLTEDGLYEVLMQSRKPIAKQFKKEVKKILKALRTGDAVLTPQLTEEQQIILQLYDGGITAVEAGKRLGEIEYGKGREYGESIGFEKGEDLGMSKICDDGVVDQKQLFIMIKETYPDDWKLLAVEPDPKDWSRFLKRMGYLRTQRFPQAKDRSKMELKAAYQPNNNFKNLFEENHLAIVKSIDDGRGKVSITYTKEISKLINTENFRHDFFQYFRLMPTEPYRYDWSIDDNKICLSNNLK